MRQSTLPECQETNAIYSPHHEKQTEELAANKLPGPAREQGPFGGRNVYIALETVIVRQGGLDRSARRNREHRGVEAIVDEGIQHVEQDVHGEGVFIN